MDLENCREEEQKTRQKKPFQGDNGGSLLKTKEGDPLEEKGRYEPFQAVHPYAQSWAVPLHSQEGHPSLRQIIFSFEIIIPMIHYTYIIA